MLAAVGLGAALGTACGGEPPPPPPEPDPATRRTLSQGEVIGTTAASGAHVWRGIPFAKPPVGERRWRAPEPPAPWDGTLEALEFGSACVQFAGPMARAEGLEAHDVRGSEDCLFLNVYAPPFPPDGVPGEGERRPVMVWIHGGGNTIGDAHLYDGGPLAARQDVVVVTIHYRLGLLGWFHHEALHGAGDDADDRSGNYGTLDTVRALEWVRDEIAAFGGDPDRVTVFGESAGARDTLALLASPRAAGLFHGAIVQSGATRTVSPAEASRPSDATPPGHENSASEVLFEQLVADGRAKDRAEAKAVAAGMPPEEIARFLRSRSPEALLARFAGDGFGGMYPVPQMIRDGHVLPEVPIPEALAAGRGHDVPVILGTNRDENKLFMVTTSPHVARVGPMPLWFRNERMYDLGAEYGSRLWKARGADEPAEVLARTGDGPVFVYRFDWDEEGRLLWADLSRLVGAAHAVEIPFVFGQLDLGRFTDYVFPEEARAAATVLSDRMMGYWADFARTGDPNGGSVATPWPAWVPGEGRMLVFDSDRDGGLSTARGVETTAGVLASVATDDRFREAAERCEIYGQMTRFGGPLDEASYRTVQGGLCRDVPLPE